MEFVEQNSKEERTCRESFQKSSWRLPESLNSKLFMHRTRLHKTRQRTTVRVRKTKGFGDVQVPSNQTGENTFSIESILEIPKSHALGIELRKS